MKPTNDKTLKEAMQHWLKAYRLKGKFDETTIISYWEEVVGKSVANRTKEIYIRDQKLFVLIESSVIKNELLMMRSKIIASLNEKVQSTLVKELILL